MVDRHEEGCYQQKVSIYFIVCKGLSNYDVRVSQNNIFQEIRPGAGFKTGVCVKEKFGGLPQNNSTAAYCPRVCFFCIGFRVWRRFCTVEGPVSGWEAGGGALYRPLCPAYNIGFGACVRSVCI